MKKMILSVALGTALVAGLFFASEVPSDLAMDLHPDILSVEKPTLFF
ncbi:hypothetical protein [Oceanobacillus halophilus]|nr:hypothetical protein [Oceanobacillus halophilus]